MELVKEIDALLDAIDREIALLDKVTLKMSHDLDAEATHDMARWLSTWEPLKDLKTLR